MPASGGTGAEAAPRVSVVIPNYNGVALLAECLESVRAQTYRDFEIVVADNGSTDDSLAWLEREATDVRVARRFPNAGFGAAVNDGVRAARGELIALLVNDTVVDREWLAQLVAALDETGFDFAAPLMVFYGAPDTVNTAGDVYDVFGASGVQRGRGCDVSGYGQPVRVLGASGGSAMYRRSFFDDVGPYDEDFYLLHEDTDVNLRALIAGKRCVYVPGAVVRHREHATIAKEPSGELARVSLRNRYVVAGKDLPGALLPLFWLSWAWRLFRRSVPLRPSQWGRIPGLLAKARDEVPVEFEGYRMGRRRRADVWRRRRASTAEIVRWLFRGTGPL